MLVLDAGHLQPVVTPVDGELAEIVPMPHDSPWPILLAASLLFVFAALVVHEYVVAGFLALVVGLALAGWHWQEPEEA